MAGVVAIFGLLKQQAMQQLTEGVFKTSRMNAAKVGFKLIEAIKAAGFEVETFNKAYGTNSFYIEFDGDNIGAIMPNGRSLGLEVRISDHTQKGWPAEFHGVRVRDGRLVQADLITPTHVDEFIAALSSIK
jgi:hypothetical protein